MLRRYLLSQARDGARADDLVQETFLQMHRARHTYDSSYPLTPWVTAIARHVWLMDCRTRSHRPWAPDDVMAMELPVMLARGFWVVGGMCFAGSAATALPVVAIASILAARAYPTRPALAGALLGLGAGLMADAGWRIFCHFSQPAHVLSAHLAAVVVSTAIGSLASLRMAGIKSETRAE